MISRGTIYLLGDGILDNFYWLEHQEQDLTRETEALGFTVRNYAADKSRVADMSQGIPLETAHIKHRFYPYPAESDGKLYPLKLLSQGTKINRSFSSAYGGISPIGLGTPTNTVVLSIGGNDLRVAISNIVFGFDYYVNSVLTPGFKAEYELLIKLILQSCERLILISIYYPYMGTGSSYAKYARFTQPMLLRWLSFLKEMASKYNVPILDLSRTLDRENRLHYGTAETEPSNLATKCIAKSLAHIHDHYTGYQVYFAPNCDVNQIAAD